MFFSKSRFSYEFPKISEISLSMPSNFWVNSYFIRIDVQFNQIRKSRHTLSLLLLGMIPNDRLLTDSHDITRIVVGKSIKNAIQARTGIPEELIKDRSL